MKRENYSSGTEWESIVGYSRAVKAGSMVYVSGTTATDGQGKIIGVNDPYQQACQAIENIKTALQRAGASLEDVVWTRMFVTDISRWEAVGRAHGKYFRNIRPVTTMVEVKRLIHPEMLVEIEAEALSH